MRCSFSRVYLAIGQSLQKFRFVGKQSLLCKATNNIWSCSRSFAMDLPSVVSVLKSVAPLELAEPWDNVGLLIEPVTSKKVLQIMLTIDLTTTVMEEAIKKHVQLIIAYHPPIFRPIKNLRNDNWKNQIALTCLEQGIAVYSPHTALDSIHGGINDWLLMCFECRTSLPIQMKKVQQHFTHTVKFHYCEYSTDYHKQLAQLLPNVKIIEHSPLEDNCMAGTLKANESDLELLTLISKKDSQFQVTDISKDPVEYGKSNSGMGRHAILANPLKISEAVDKVKSFFNLKKVRISLAKECTMDSVIQTVAVCAGSGAGVLHGVKADLFLTGEMSHHELLDAIHNGATVILTEHSNSERRYLEHLAEILMKRLPGVAVVYSSSDSDPVLIV